MKHIIDIETWERRDNYNFFRGYVSSWTTLSTELDCTFAFPAAKAVKRSFFTCYLYAILRAANEVKEFRFRTDKEGNVACYDKIDMLTPIAVPGRTFYEVRIPYEEDFETFYRQAREIITNIPKDGDPYLVSKQVIDKGDFDVILLSATPNLYFTGIGYTISSIGNPHEYPLMNVGKAIEREGKLIMPFSFCFNHQFVDGEHVARFIDKIQEHLNSSL